MNEWGHDNIHASFCTSLISLERVRPHWMGSPMNFIPKWDKAVYSGPTVQPVGAHGRLRTDLTEAVPLTRRGWTDAI